MARVVVKTPPGAGPPNPGGASVVTMKGREIVGRAREVNNED
jgi:hypothetical protein